LKNIWMMMMKRWNHSPLVEAAQHLVNALTLNFANYLIVPKTNSIMKRPSESLKIQKAPWEKNL
jgi:hypothetical protein